uniref:Uncharacterized protein n=1 Tax=Strombidinopsis acuminata TaxID=141414 RepID=A0A7S3U5Y0_9SPIT|mmetsp:Transcript_21960/g.66765  ORF Transcript_21960/g.66765 Transcript_21960/m.66765 type:complete len:102 (+) Transcript_21960:2121-2426(+)|eukprot:scaffold23283_cov39-Tisochrysis_lutea.AAC.2
MVCHTRWYRARSTGSSEAASWETSTKLYSDPSPPLLVVPCWRLLFVLCIHVVARGQCAVSPSLVAAPSRCAADGFLSGLGQKLRHAPLDRDDETTTATLCA